jgi:hypothetical protein
MVTEEEQVLPELPPYAAPGEGDRNWSGYLTVENHRHVARRFAQMFAGRSFTITTAHEYRRWEPEVRTGGKLNAHNRTSGELVDTHDEVHSYDWGDYRSCGIGFSAGSWSFGFSTQLLRQPPWFWLMEPDAELGGYPDGRRDVRGYMHGSPREVLDYIDAARRADDSTVVVFDGRSCKLSQRTPEGKGSVCVFTLEPELKHVRELLELVEHHEAITAADESTQALFARVAENARWELDSDWA